VGEEISLLALLDDEDPDVVGYAFKEVEVEISLLTLLHEVESELR